MKHNDTNMQTTDPLLIEVRSEYEWAQDIVDKIMCLDPITIEWIKRLMKQWDDAEHRKGAAFYEKKKKIVKDIFQVLLDNGILNESDVITGCSNVILIEGQLYQAVWLRDINRFLENNKQ